MTTSEKNCVTNGASVSIGTNHGHEAPVITPSDVSAGIHTQYNITAGTAGHTHTVTVTAGDFTDLQRNANQVITTDPDGTGHSHDISINCV